MSAALAMNARTVHELPWQLNGRRAASTARKQDAHPSEPEGPLQGRVPAERDGPNHDKHDLVWLHVGNPYLFLSGIGQKRHRGLRTTNQEAAGVWRRVSAGVCSFGDSLGAPVG